MNIHSLEENIVGDRCVLEPILPKHAALLFDDLQSLELYRYIPHEPPVSLRALQDRYKAWSARGSSDGNETWLNYAVYGPKMGRYLGTLQATLHKEGKTDIAYEVFPPYWRQGVGRETVSLLTSCLFGGFDVELATAHVDTENTRSIKLLERLGFTRTAFLKNADYFKGRASDEYVFELHARDV
ncbi:MAG: GNAT family protein [Algisphaera sp.]